MKIVANIILIFLLGAMFVSLFYLSTDMTGDTMACPFMTHEEVLCPMNLADHLGAWKSAFVAMAPSIALLFAAVSVALLIVSVAPHLFAQKQHLTLVRYKQLRAQTYTFSYRPLQELFSNGILHPKVF